MDGEEGGQHREITPDTIERPESTIEPCHGRRKPRSFQGADARAQVLLLRARRRRGLREVRERLGPERVRGRELAYTGCGRDSGIARSGPEPEITTVSYSSVVWVGNIFT